MTVATAFPPHVLGLRGCMRCRRIMLAERSADHVCWGGSQPPRHFRHEIAVRDAWTCQLCEMPVDGSLPRSNPLGPSLDHRTPRSDGGDHSPDNLQLAHAICNWVRNSRPLEEIEPAEHRARIAEIMARLAAREHSLADERERARREGIRRRRRGQRARRRLRLLSGLDPALAQAA